MRAYFVVTHATGLTREQWQQLDQDVSDSDRLRSLNSWQAAGREPGSPPPLNLLVQLANKLEPTPGDPNLFTRSLAGLDIETETQRQLPGAPLSVEVRLVNYLRQAIRSVVPGPQQNDYDVQLVSTDTTDQSAISGVHTWLDANWNYPESV